MTASTYEEGQLDGFKRSQRLAYECAVHVESRLRPGMTEKEAAKMLGDYARRRGVRAWFHEPIAWFGERTAFEGFRSDLDFAPKARRLAWGVPVILDLAPIVDGYASDVGHACVPVGHNSLHEKMLADLEPVRSLILEGVLAEKTQQQIYREVDEVIRELGYENRHARYPFHVLGHRVEYLKPSGVERLAERLTVRGFGVPTLRYLASEMYSFRRGDQEQSPLWNGSSRCNRPAEPGLWAIEPHIGCDGVGVKFEELLVVTDRDAHWLDDDLPHVRRWNAQRAAAAAQEPLHAAAS